MGGGGGAEVGFGVTGTGFCVVEMILIGAVSTGTTGDSMKLGSCSCRLGGEIGLSFSLKIRTGFRILCISSGAKTRSVPLQPSGKK